LLTAAGVADEQRYALGHGLIDGLDQTVETAGEQANAGEGWRDQVRLWDDLGKA
jgi:hypothetical protein